MDDPAADARPATPAPAAEITLIDGVEVMLFTAVVDRLCADYPAVSPTRIEGVLIREWEAYAAGRPLVVPIAVEEGVREVLEQG